MLGDGTVGHAVEMVHGVGFVMLGKITRLGGGQAVVLSQRFEEI